jgi:hypothetical protein
MPDIPVVEIDETKEKVTRAEKDFSTEVKAFFRDKLKHSGLDLEVEERKMILTDFTVGRVNGHWKLIAGFQQQDIVIFNSKDSISVSDFSSNFLHIAKLDRKGEKPIIIPVVICELKVDRKDLQTPSLITYSSIADHIKTIFPHCRYYFVMDSNKVRNMRHVTLLRHSKGFDRVFSEWEIEKEQLWKVIQDTLTT